MWNWRNVVVGVPISICRPPPLLPTIRECKNRCGAYISSDTGFCGNCRCLALHCQRKRMSQEEYCGIHWNLKYSDFVNGLDDRSSM